MKVADGNLVRVVMEEDSKQLEEVVVVGYGTQKKANLSGSVSTVKMDEGLGSRPQPNTAAALQGAIPGLTITSGSNTPGQTGKSIQIRDTATFSGKNDGTTGLAPLVLIDNVPGDIDTLNPEDIESVTVLKDASSSAIYGARAAAGVVLITTKRPNKEEKVSVTYNNNFGFVNAVNTPKQVGLETFLPIYKETLGNTFAGGNNQNIDSWMEYLNQFAPRGIYNAAEGTYRIPNWASGYHLTPYHKALPSSNWAGNYLRNVPTVQTSNFQNNESAAAGIQLIYSGSGFQRGKSGYFVWKHHASWDKQDQNHPMEVSDKPVFKIEEVMLNYAEVMFELGKFDQSVADLTINKLRDRAEVGLMRVSEIGSDFDPDRDPSVEPVLWEIRRERLIELMGESFSWEDVRRWKKADYFVNKQHYGVYLDNVTGTFNNNKATTGGTGILNPDTKKEASDAELAAMGNCGHLYYYLDPVSAGKGWLDKYYLRPIPSDELLLNDNLEQQEAWK